MRRVLHAGLLMGTILAGVLAISGEAALAQDEMYATDAADSAIGLDSFSNQLAPYGYWLYSDRWGLVWQPGQVSADFHPYFSDGHWVYTDDYGWYWQSDRPWGDIAFHYGRWVDDPDDGWLWIPGYVWSPGWVVWRSNGRYIGWMPMPPDEAFLEGRGDLGAGASFHFGVGGVSAFYGYSRWYPDYNQDRFARNWVFVGAGQITAPSYRAIAIRNPAQVINIIHNTRNVTNYTVINNHVVNRSVDVNIVERAMGHPIRVVHAAAVIRNPRLVTTLAVGQRVQMRVREIAPRGTGVANSAPPPPARVVAKLSTHVPVSHGRGPTHLFTRSTVSAPQAQGRFHGAPAKAAQGPNGATAPNGARPGEAQPGAMTGPTGERHHEAAPGGMTGPNGAGGPNGERPHEAQPNGMANPNGARQRETTPSGMTGPNGQQTNGTTGPGPERHHEAPPNGMMGPSGQQPNGTTGPGSERQHEAPPNGMMGPSGQKPNGMAGPGTERRPPTQPNGMVSPNGERPNEAQPNGTNGPMGERPHQPQPGGAAGPNREQPPPNQQGQQPPPPHRQKKEQNPPNPPQ
jgi:hypothetical protein